MAPTVAIIDYGSGNLRSAAKAIERAAGELDGTFFFCMSFWRIPNF